MTDHEAVREARRRAFRAIDETCPIVQSICNDADIDCGVDHDDASSEISSVHSEIECQLGTLSDIASRLERSSRDYASIEDVPSAILDRVTGPFRESLIEAYKELVVGEGMLADLTAEREDTERDLRNARTSDRRARYAIRMHLTMRRLTAS